MADSDERIQVASAFVLQSPPGEINDVLNGSRSRTPLIRYVYLRDTPGSSRVDVRVIVNDDDVLEDGLLPALRDYNLAQFILVDVPDANHQVDPMHILSSGPHEPPPPFRPSSVTSRGYKTVAKRKSASWIPVPRRLSDSIT
jgi:hypothetical protein